MDNFRTLDQLSAEQQKVRKRSRIRLGILIAFLLLMGLDYLISWPQSTRKQQALESAINALYLPSATVQENVVAGHKPRSGFVTRLFLSSRDPQIVCEFFSNELIADGWTAVENNCAEASKKQRRPRRCTPRMGMVS